MLPNEWGFVHSEHYFNLAFQKVICKIVLTDKRKGFFFLLYRKRFLELGKKLKEKNKCM